MLFPLWKSLEVSFDWNETHNISTVRLQRAVQQHKEYWNRLNGRVSLNDVYLLNKRMFIQRCLLDVYQTMRNVLALYNPSIIHMCVFFPSSFLVCCCCLINTTKLKISINVSLNGCMCGENEIRAFHWSAALIHFSIHISCALVHRKVFSLQMI